MKTVILSMLSFILGLSVTASASEMMNASFASSELPSSYSPEYCQFSLTSYAGTILPNGKTDVFKVGLSCPQQSDVRATVVVFINDEHIASQVVTIKAGEEYSERVQIRVGESYKGQRYKLVVQ